MPQGIEPRKSGKKFSKRRKILSHPELVSNHTNQRDDTIITVFGGQEGSEVGYNPRYHGRASYKAKVAFISGTGELVNAGLYGGKTASNGSFLEFLHETLTRLNSLPVCKVSSQPLAGEDNHLIFFLIRTGLAPVARYGLYQFSS